MAAPTKNNWTELFEPARSSDASLAMCWRVLRKRGQPFLILPASPRLAAQGLCLYQPQAPLARIVTALVGGALRIGVPVGGEKISLAISDQDPLLDFLAQQTDQSLAQIAPPAILTGNPNSPGQRFVLLAFDKDGRPVRVLKVGLNTSARQLIQQETAILSALPPNLPGTPGLRGSFQSPSISVFAQDYFGGVSPRDASPQTIGVLLSSWISSGKSISVEATPTWQRLKSACASSPVFRQLERQLSHRTIHPALFHGDFAPWNIKATSQRGDWKVLDWERGELLGLPGWDWFHFVIQNGILTRRLPVGQLADEVASLLRDEEFQRYAQSAGIAGIERPLVLAYLLHNNEVIRPSEGLSDATELLNLLRSRWEEH